MICTAKANKVFLKTLHIAVLLLVYYDFLSSLWWVPAAKPLTIHLLYARLCAMLLHKTDKAITFGLVRCGIAYNPTV